MDEHGAPRAYTAMTTGVDVISADGQVVGTLEHVLADEEADIFDGLVISVPGGHRFVDAPEVADLRERAAFLSLSAAEVDRLPEPSANPAVMQHDGAEDNESPLVQKLRRAWDLLSGRY